MKTKNYNDKLKDPRWQRRRLEIMQRADFACEICGDRSEELHIHHKKYRGEPWDASDSELECLCSTCHTIKHLDPNKVGMAAHAIMPPRAAINARAQGNCIQWWDEMSAYWGERRGRAIEALVRITMVNCDEKSDLAAAIAEMRKLARDAVPEYLKVQKILKYADNCTPPPQLRED